MNDLQVFKNAEFGEIRTVTINDEVWFVGKDVATALGYGDTNQAVRKHVDEDDKLSRRFDVSGQKRLFEWLRNNGYLIKHKGTDRNMPTQKAMEMGLFEVKESTTYNPDCSIRINKTTKVTGKGQLYFVNKFLGERSDSDD